MKLLRVVVGVGLLFGAVASCRDASLCGDDPCGTAVAGAGGTAGGEAREPDVSGAAGQPTHPGGAGAGGVQADEADEADEAGGTGGDRQQPQPLTCDDGMDDCDGSRFTGCETELSWTQRHCGACGNVCDGACDFGECLPADVITRDLEATALVSNQSHAYVTLERNDAFVGRIELQSGELESVLEGLETDSKLSMSHDRVYVFDPTNERLYTIPFGANQVATPENVPRPSSVGASPDGAYYVRYADYEAEDQSDELWFRLDAADPWQKLASASSMRILSSSVYGVVLEQELPDETTHLYTLQGKDIVDQGPAPSDLYQAVAVVDGVAALARDGGEWGSWHLYWLKPDAPLTHYALEGELVEYGTSLFAYDDRVAVTLEDRSRMYLQFFDEARPRREKLGLASYSVVAAIDNTYVWHTTYDSWITLRVLRSQWVRFDDI